MRHVGTIQQPQEAARFSAYLLTLGINAQAEQEDDGWSIWIREEDHVSDARAELQSFLADPAAERYRDVERAAAKIQNEQRVKRELAEKNVVDYRKKWSRGAYERIPMVMVLVLLSIVVTLLTNFGKDPGWTSEITFADPREAPTGSDYLISIRSGEVWRLVTPIFMHLDGFHILFNMLWLFVLGSQCERLRGTLKFGGIVLVTALVSNFLQAAVPMKFGGTFVFGGMSGVVYGLFGYVWVKSRLVPDQGFMLSDFTVILMLAWLIFCITGGAGSVANVAHVAGLVTGIALAYLPIAMQPQRQT